ncbi:MAG: zinc-ribbon domain-containing protein [Methanoregula sp.]|nr:zinc-ribbon domain-containing protein [Methanoregula sp.]
MIVLQFCPQCGNAVAPEKKFCTSCGATLQPDLTGTGEPASPQPGQNARSGPATHSGIQSRGTLIAVAGLAIVLLLVIILGYPIIAGKGLIAPGTPVTPAMTPSAANGSGKTPGGSYVIVETEILTMEPTTLLTTATTPVPTRTTTPTTVPVTKAVFCSSDTLSCNNSCIDPRTDNYHCGNCNNSCSVGKFCLNGNCAVTCSAEQTSCPDGCFNLLTNPKHCGSCGNSCPNGLICTRGRCDSPATPMPVPV